MEAGREIDRLVAEKVMGWQWTPRESFFYPPVFYPPDLHPLDNIFGHEVPKFSTDIASAWRIVERFRRGEQRAKIDALSVAACVELEISDYPSPQGDCLCRIYSPCCAKVEVVANEMPLAICIASLKAVGYDV